MPELVCLGKKLAGPACLPAVAQEEASRLKGSPCQLVVAETSHAEGPRSLYILQRWLPLVLHIRRECLPLACRLCFEATCCCCQARGLPIPGVKPQHAGCPRPAHAAVGQAQALAVLSPRLDVPPACLVQLIFSLKHGALTFEGMQPAGC
jgi:hypothetical protein